MDSRARVYVRTGIVGAWAVFVGIALALTASRLLAIVTPAESGTDPLIAAGLPLTTILLDGVTTLYEGGAASVIVGIILVFVGWYQLLQLD